MLKGFPGTRGRRLRGVRSPPEIPTPPSFSKHTGSVWLQIQRNSFSAHWLSDTGSSPFPVASSLEDAFNKQNPFLIFLHKYFRRLRNKQICCWLFRNGGSQLQAGPSLPPQGKHCSLGRGKHTMARTAPFLPGMHTWVGEPGSLVEENGPAFYQKHPHPPPTYCLLFLEMEEHRLLSVCCSWGRFSRCCPRPRGRGHEVPAEAGTTHQEEGAERPRTGGRELRLETSAI